MERALTILPALTLLAAAAWSCLVAIARPVGRLVAWPVLRWFAFWDWLAGQRGPIVRGVELAAALGAGGLGLAGLAGWTERTPESGLVVLALISAAYLTGPAVRLVRFAWRTARRYPDAALALLMLAAAGGLALIAALAFPELAHAAGGLSLATLAAPARLAHRPAPAPEPLAWGARVSPAFRAKVRDLVKPLGGCTANDLMTCMAWESGRSFRADVRNMAGSGATGLIQFMPATAKGLGTTTAALARMTPESQLDYVAKYFAPYAGRLRDLADLYMAILWPAAIGKPADYVLFDQAKRPTAYRQNAGLDVDRNGQVTKAEASRKVLALLPEGLSPLNRA